MSIYIIVFTISILCAHIVEKSTNRLAIIIASILAVLFPAVLAGVRDSGVGYDTQVYGEHHFDMMMTLYGNKNFGEYIRDIFFIRNDIREHLYHILMFFSVKLGNSVNWSFFVLNLFMCSFTYLAIYQNREKASMAFMMFVFLFSYYNISLNIMRQTLAMSLLLFSYKFIEDKTWIKAFIYVFLCIFCHHTGFFCVAIFIYFALLKIYGEKFKFSILFMLLIPIGFNHVGYFLSNLNDYGVLPERFTNYALSSGGFMASTFTFGAILYLSMLCAQSYLPFNLKEKTALYSNTKLFYLICILMQLLTTWGFRLSYYFGFFDILFIPRLIKLLSKHNKKKSHLLKVVIIVIIITNWYWSIIYHNDNSTYPYQSQILKDLGVL